MFKRIMSVLLAGAILTGTAISLSSCGEDGEQSTGELSVDFKTAENLADGTILQAFSWDFNTIKNSMADIAAAGFSAVQTSPINECLEGEDGGMQLYGNGKWYYHYQPTDFKIGNYQLGTRDEFKEMCDEADKYGIKVIVDVIANHTTPQLDKVSDELINAGGGSTETLYHKNNSSDIIDYSDRLQCTTAKMGGLPDINTERPSYQDYFISYINDCIACGADGFRYDTAKHIGLPDDPKENDGFKNNFWERVTKEIDKADDMFIYGEVLQGGNDRIEDYIKTIGRTTASTYGSKIRAALTNEMVDTSMVKEYWLGSAPLNMVTWVESHDNYINDGTWAQLDNDHVILGWAIITARKDGTPLFFSRPYGASAKNLWGMNRIGAQGDDMYKDARVSAVNFFRTAMAGEEENLVNPTSDASVLIIERGRKGAVIVTTDDAEVNFETSLADGTYIDRVDNKTVYTVKDGKMTCEKPIPGNSVVVLYNEGYTAYAPCANVGVADGTEFEVDADSAELTLTLSGASKGTYSIDGDKAVEYSDGDKITVEKPDDGVAEIELRAENDKKIPTYEKVVITFKQDYSVKKGDKIYFTKPEKWSEDVCVYVYNDDDDEIEVWPGEEMKKDSNGKYSYEFTEDFKNPLLIFNYGGGDNGQQFPSDRGLKGEADKTYSVE